MLLYHGVDISHPSANEVHRDVLHLWLLRQNHDPNGQCRGEPRNEIHFHPIIPEKKEKKRRCWCFAINMSNHKMTPARWLRTHSLLRFFLCQGHWFMMPYCSRTFSTGTSSERCATSRDRSKFWQSTINKPALPLIKFFKKFQNTEQKKYLNLRSFMKNV